MIRRMFWLTAGAVLGVTAYRRVAALGRYVPPALRAGELTRFAADVREGMEIYAQRHGEHGSPGDRGRHRERRSSGGHGSPEEHGSHQENGGHRERGAQRRPPRHTLESRGRGDAGGKPAVPGRSSAAVPGRSTDDEKDGR